MGSVKVASTVSAIVKAREAGGVASPHTSTRVFPSLPGARKIRKLPAVTIGDDNFTRITAVPSSEPQMPLAPTTFTGYGPAIVKSLPSAAIVEQSIFFENTSFNTPGAQPGGAILSSGVGCGGPKVKG